jgi:hypothetical protein
MSSQTDLKRMARLRAAGLSVRSALTLGLSLAHVDASRGTTRYNGAGLKGDREAVARDFAKAVEKTPRRSSLNG